MNPVRRDTILTILGLSMMVAFFVFAVYMPGQNACDKAKAEIAQSLKTIEDNPKRALEVKALEDDVQTREDYLQANSRLLANTNELHIVIRDVADLARQSRLDVTRLEPLSPIVRESYQIVPYRISLAGEFGGIAGFLQGLESQQRLVTVEQLSLSGESGQNSKTVDGDMYFSVYLHPSKLNESVDIDAS